MDKSTRNLLTYAAVGVGAYYVWNNFLSPNAQAARAAALLPGSAETPTERAQSAAATLAANLESMFPG